MYRHDGPDRAPMDGYARYACKSDQSRNRSPFGLCSDDRAERAQRTPNARASCRDRDETPTQACRTEPPRRACPAAPPKTRCATVARIIRAGDVKAAPPSAVRRQEPPKRWRSWARTSGGGRRVRDATCDACFVTRSQRGCEPSARRAHRRHRGATERLPNPVSVRGPRSTPRAAAYSLLAPPASRSWCALVKKLR